MTEEQEHPEEERTPREFQRVNFEGTWSNNGRSNGHNGSTTKALAVEVEPECDICNDTLWVATASGDASSPAKVTPCKCQNKVRDASEHLRAYSELGLLERMTFESLKPKGRKGRVEPEQFRAALESAKQYAEKPDGWLVIQGPAGSGKTHLAVAIANEVIARGEPVKYVSALGIPEIITSSSYRTSTGDNMDSFNALLDAPLLLIDDLATYRVASWIESKIDQLLTHRSDNRMPTVIVLAKTQDQIPERMATRLDDPNLSKLVTIVPPAASDDKRSHIPANLLRKMTFDSFDPKGAAPSTVEDQFALGIALRRARDYADNPSGWLYLHGPTGVGKTHLAVAIAKVVLERDDNVTFWKVPDLLDWLRSTYDYRDEKSFYQVFGRIRDVDLLILDDFASYSVTDWSLEKIYQIIVHRYDRLMPTVITSPLKLWTSPYILEEHRVNNPNLDRIHHKQLWESIMSRIYDSRVVTDALMSAPDYRKRLA